MTVKRVVPHGEWESPISIESVASGARSLSAPRVCSKTGRVFFLEGDGTGRTAIMELTSHGTVDILPKECSVGNTVYEYGVQALQTLPDGRLIFSSKDNTVRILDPSTSKVTTVLQNSPILRHGSFTADKTSSWVLAIQEDHTNNTPYGIENYIAAIHVGTGNVKRVISGADYYFQPRFNDDGTRLVWLEWNHPEMLFDMARLYSADWDGGAAAVRNVTLVAGGNSEGVCEPHWGPDGALYFSQEIGGHRQLLRIGPEGGKPMHIALSGLTSFDLGESSLSEASRTYVALSSRYLLVNAVADGTCRLLGIDLEQETWKHIAHDLDISALGADCISRIDESSALVVAKGLTTSNSLFKIDIHSRAKNKLLRTAGLSGSDFSAGLLSLPEHITIDSRREPRQTHGFLFMPRNNKFVAEQGTLPPLIIFAHGGPTGMANSGFNLRAQYFTSRGYAFLTVNYVGSTGYGTAYRRYLYGRWGVSDTNDVADFAAHLVETGRVRAGAVGITGGSAGGYNTLQALTRYPTSFAGGVCACGISDLIQFDDHTHKLESDYAAALLLPEGTPEEDKVRIYKERSARYHADKIQSPLLLVHGTADSVVPVVQARIIHDIVKKKGGDVKLVEIPDEGHMLSKPDTVRKYLAEEEAWWRKTLLKV
ncbi:dipeptidyl peptidase IV, putative [Cordyceps militaris CM01]|uniref:Dipeptidyl peptidase IV, putative n=1 Tax=Cordyceps militaris (strain CM01) TaxID=983644 RepID=G3J7M3_CORMM|nr:dipeptidyl peptidase IV, putative [Cordyceps militaris CM01]EGX95489.1 dipeptidyl peptidase IV, putative [Cordyceps militaris CM01]